MIEHESLIMPSSPEDRKKLKGAINEIVNSFTRIKAEQVAKKEMISAIADEWELPKKLIAAAAKTIYKENLQKVAAESEDLITFVETIQMVTPVLSAVAND